MPKGFYLKRGIWYKRIWKPNPNTGVWNLQAESTGCREADRRGAIEYVARREEELGRARRIFRVGIGLGKVQTMPAGGCDFHKRPEKENTRRVRLPDRYYAFFRDSLHPALKCLFIVGYNTGRRLSELLALRWDRVDFEESCLYFEATKFGSGKAPFVGEMERGLREQRELRDAFFPECPFVFFWFNYRVDKDGEQIRRFDGMWREAVTALGKRMRSEGEEPIPLHFHDLRRSAHF